MTPNAKWRKSAYTSATGQCVEVRLAASGRVLVRDSKNHEAGTIALSEQAWKCLLVTAWLRPTS
ncbi:DUF397 domain-containing protein [Streptomyces sp. NPDC048710]|uniref:DUF397 domain-containing protein n=1 Tax=unclassified Streptomyces TaxID=2593676 RepID=UPI003713656F